VLRSLAILVALVFSKNVYLASLTSFYTFYLIHKFGVSVQSAQLHLFIFLGAAAAGTFIGGPVGDRIGRKYVIWASILGVAPFTLWLPLRESVLDRDADRGDLASSWPLGLLGDRACLRAGELPGRVGTISGLFFGFAFGAGAGRSAARPASRTPRASTWSTRCALPPPAIGLLTLSCPTRTGRKPAPGEASSSGPSPWQELSPEAKGPTSARHLRTFAEPLTSPHSARPVLADHLRAPWRRRGGRRWRDPDPA
jgi:FSR family fosmidomycin resistance protein-like MFS transporter